MGQEHPGVGTCARCGTCYISDTELFHVLVADCPWKFDDALPGPNRGAEKNYPCLSIEELCTFQLPPMAEDSVLFFWRVSVMQQEALDVVRAWGFKVKGEVVWLKKTVSGGRFFGMGRIVRAEHEICLIATRGKPQVLNHSTRSTFTTEEMDFEGLSAVNTRHSAKPEQFYSIIESLFAPPYCEMFARRIRPGWVCLGNEVTA